MMFLLDWINPAEFLPLVVLICLLVFIGGQMTRADTETYRRAQRISAAAFLLYAGMGIYAWEPAGATEFVFITLRASLAAGVAFGLALVTLAPAAFLIERVKTLITQIPKPRPAEPPKPPPPPVTRPRDFAAEEQAEKERMSKIDDARTMTTQFYEEHGELLNESFPPALFKSQMHTRFPDDITPDQAWQSAQTMIGEMIPLIAKAREQKRAEQEEERKQQAEAAQNDMKSEDDKNTIHRITDWYQRERETLMSLPESDERENFLLQLEERCDRMIKDALAEARP